MFQTCCWGATSIKLAACTFLRTSAGNKHAGDRRNGGRGTSCPCKGGKYLAQLGPALKTGRDCECQARCAVSQRTIRQGCSGGPHVLRANSAPV